MFEGSFVFTTVLGFIAIVAMGILVSIATGTLQLEKAERKSLAVVSGVVLISIAIYAVLA